MYNWYKVTMQQGADCYKDIFVAARCEKEAWGIARARTHGMVIKIELL